MHLVVTNAGEESIQEQITADVRLFAPHESFLPSALNIWRDVRVEQCCHCICNLQLLVCPSIRASWAYIMAASANLYEQTVMLTTGAVNRHFDYYDWSEVFLRHESAYQLTPISWYLLLDSTDVSHVYLHNYYGELDWMLCTLTDGPAYPVQERSLSAMQEFFNLEWPATWLGHFTLNIDRQDGRTRSDLVEVADGIIVPRGLSGVPVAENGWCFRVNGPAFSGVVGVYHGDGNDRLDAAFNHDVGVAWVRGRLRARSTIAKQTYWIGRYRKFDIAVEPGRPAPEYPDWVDGEAHPDLTHPVLDVKLPDYELTFESWGVMAIQADEIIGDAGDIELPFPDTYPYPTPSRDYDGHPVALVADAYFVVISDDPEAWASAVGLQFGVTWSRWYMDGATLMSESGCDESIVPPPPSSASDDSSASNNITSAD